MKRRAFLGTAVAGAAVAAGSSWIERAFAQPRPAADGLAVLSTAYRRAQRAGKPLLVIVIPADAMAKHARGQAFGQLLNYGTDAVMATLAVCDVACAEMGAVRQLVPQLPATPPEPLMVLIETDAVPARVRALHASISDPYDVSLGALVTANVSPDAAAIARRATQARARIGALRLAQIERALAAGTLGVADADAAAAIVAERAQARPAERARATAVLAAAAIARLRARRIDGSHWATSWGCGTDIEDTPVDEGGMVDCGMGHIEPRSRRFLYFFAPRTYGAP